MIHNHHELSNPALLGGITLAAAYIAGIASSLHCLVMCGGVSGALGMRARALGASASRSLLHGIGYQIGRIFSYVIAGALCGAFGQALASMINVVQVGSLLHVLAGVLLITLATRFLFGWRLLDRLERAGAVVWRQLAPLARRNNGNGVANSLLLGALWGWMPCGLVYSMLLFAALAGTAIQGAAVMALFGLGTLPAMLGSTLLASQLQRFTRRPGFSKFSGALLLLFGVATVVVPLTGMHH
jgi:sulfite exporter TauE/SafE